MILNSKAQVNILKMDGPNTKRNANICHNRIINIEMK